MSFSYQDRAEIVKDLANTELDLLVIGGGITGAGVLLQATAMGMKTGLVEMQDFSEGTSSRSTKLVHGGIRYLRTFDVGIVKDTVTERAVVQGIAPHIPRPMTMLLPIYDEPDATFDMFSLKVAMDLYDQLAGVQGTKYANRIIERDEVLEREPHLKSENLIGGGLYLDFTNNDARLVIENIKEADSRGALAASRVKATGILHDENGQVNGITAHDEISGEDFEIHAKIVINTAGPWVDKVLGIDQKNDIPTKLHPTKGVHLVVDESVLKVPQPTYFDTGLGDGRMMFVIPREGKTYFGTTDTDFSADFKKPEVLQEDVDYLLKIINNRYPDADITQDKIEASWAGIRPLLISNRSSDYNGGGAGTGKVSDQSFSHLINMIDKFEDSEVSKSDVEKALGSLKTEKVEASPNKTQVSRGADVDVSSDGLVILSGGKITDYRKMAAGALKVISEIFTDKFGKNFNAIDSKKLQVSGGHFDPSAVDENIKNYTQMGIDKNLSKEDAAYLANRYGSNTPIVLEYIDKIEAAPGLSLAETISLYYALEHEMTLTPVDYLLRRTNNILFQADKIDGIVEPVVNKMAKYYNWTDEIRNQMLLDVKSELQKSRLEYL